MIDGFPGESPVNGGSGNSETHRTLLLQLFQVGQEIEVCHIRLLIDNYPQVGVV